MTVKRSLASLLGTLTKRVLSPFELYDNAMNERRSAPAMDERARRLLKSLVETHITFGKPVGSRTLSRLPGLDLSPATIRNVMADLEEMGYLESPHTSAGRIPTARGYRFFVDALLEWHPLDRDAVYGLEQQMERAEGTQSLLDSTSEHLAELTRLAGIVTLPRRDAVRLRHVEFLPLSDRRILAILVVNEQEVQNRVLHTERDFNADELQKMGNYLTAHYSGKELAQIRTDLASELERVRADMDRIRREAVSLAGQVFAAEETGEDLVVTGQTHLMEIDELADLRRLRDLFKAFNQKQDLLHLLDQCLQAEGVQIFIGQESGYDPLEACSMIAAPYAADGEWLGVIGVIGPTRMAYNRIIPIVDIASRLLGTALTSR